MPTAQPWVQQQLARLAFAGTAQPFRTYSYLDVLRGQMPADAFADKYVLIGAVATGLGDFFATPGHSTGGLMPGVEIVAHALDMQLAGVHIDLNP